MIVLINTKVSLKSGITGFKTVDSRIQDCLEQLPYMG